MSRSLRGQVAGTPAPMPGWWLAVCGTAAIVVVAAAALSFPGQGGLVLGPLLAIPAALAGIGAPTPRRPLAYGTVMLLTAAVLAPFARGSLLWIATTVSVVVVAAVSAIGAVLSGPGKQKLANVTPAAEKLANVTSVAEAGGARCSGRCPGGSARWSSGWSTWRPQPRPGSAGTCMRSRAPSSGSG